MASTTADTPLIDMDLLKARWESRLQQLYVTPQRFAQMALELGHTVNMAAPTPLPMPDIRPTGLAAPTSLKLSSHIPPRLSESTSDPSQSSTDAAGLHTGARRRSRDSTAFNSLSSSDELSSSHTTTVADFETIQSSSSSSLESVLKCKGGRPPDDRIWRAQFAKLEAYKAQHGHVQVPYRSADQKLGQWVKNQRALYKRGKLSSYRVQKLESLGFNWRVVDK